jgi:HAD superfamily hydrolase (TIGR01662 family)
VKAIFFDANGIIYSRGITRPHLRAFLEGHGLPMPPIAEINATIAEVRSRAFVGATSREELFDAVLAACGATDAALREDGRRTQTEDDAAIVLYEGVLETLPALRARGFKLGVITDASASTAEKLRWFAARGLHIAWDAFADSPEVGARKPDPRMYETALTQCGVPAGESVFVGHKTSELEGARAVGMTTIACNYDADAQADYYIERFADLLKLPLLQRAA